METERKEINEEKSTAIIDSNVNPTSITMDCDKDATAMLTDDYYTLYISVIGCGWVDTTPPGRTYPSGTVVQITAMPCPCWMFAFWSGDIAGTENPTCITMDSDMNIIAHFWYTFPIEIVGCGYVIKEPNWSAYPVDTTVQLTAEPCPGWLFDSWSGDIVGSDNPIILVVQDDMTEGVTATFTQNTYTLNITVIIGGDVIKNPDWDLYPEGTVVELTAVPYPGWYFDWWQGDVAYPSSPTTNITMDDNKEVTAWFCTTPTVITITIIGNGMVTKDPDQYTYIYGTGVILTAVPDDDWSFDHWSGDLEGNETPTIIFMDGSKEVTATFTDIMPPEITNVMATPPSQVPGGHVNITATVTDNVAVDTVLVDITSPMFATEEMTNIPGTDTYYYNTTYTEIGTYDYFIWANDTSGNTNVSADYTFEIINTPPNTPSDPDPEDGETDVDIDADLSWNCSDPDGDSLTYDVYFEANDPTPDELVSENQTGTTYDPGTMNYSTTYYWQIIVADKYGATTEGPIWQFTTEETPEPDLDCEGSFSWTDVKPGSTVTDNFTVKNIGDPGSLLDWEVIEWPDWGDWSFDPDSGTGLPDGSSETVDVEVVAPDEEKTEFEGEIKIVNSENPDDYCIIPVSLITPVSQNSVDSLLLQFLQRFIERFPLLERMFELRSYFKRI